MYLYVYRQLTYCGSERTKVGVSRAPEKRKFGAYRVGGFVFHRKWSMPSREAAFALETEVCRAFPHYYRRELLDATPTDVCAFIEARL